MLVVPAAGLGSRLRSTLPKVLVPVAGRPMLDWLVELYSFWVERFIIIVNPAFRTDVSEHVSTLGVPAIVVEQPTPTGMLDAMLVARPVVEAGSAGHVWITWCDQVGIRPLTVRRLAAFSETNPAAAIVMPTCKREHPYIHFLRGSDRRIVQVLQRREGDVMPLVGESDVGLFSLSRRAFVDDLRDFAGAVVPGEGTGERNFLPFIPWVESRGGVLTYPCEDELEATGINTPEELSLIERSLRSRPRS